MGFKSNLYQACVRKKSIVTSSSTVTELHRCLTTLDLTFIGIGTTMGAGIYVLTGEVARNQAGPAIVLSFLIAAVASLLSGLCYAELGARVPKAGSAYLYCYVTIGEFCSFFIGWNMILEYSIGASAIIRALSSYIDTFVDGAIRNTTINAIGEINSPVFSSYFDFLSLVISVTVTIMLSLGVKNSARFNNACVVVNILTIVVVVIAGIFYAEPKNWENFAPFGVSGVLAGAATCFFSFIGFDVIATTSEEAMNPGRAIPISMTCTIVVCFIAYVVVSTVITLMVPYYKLDVNSAVAMAFHQRGFNSMGYVVAAGAVMGMTGCVIISCMPLPRMLYALSQDGMIPKVFSRVNQRTSVPVVATVIAGLLTGLLAALLDINKLVEMLSIGTLMAYSIVDICILIIRYEDRTNDDSSSTTVGRADDEEPLIINESPTKSTSGKKIKNKNLILHLNIFFLLIELFTINTILSRYTSYMHKYPLLIFAMCLACIGLFISCYIFVKRTPNNDELTFKVPFMPWVPLIALFFNSYLMLSLSRATLYRLLAWMAVGIVVYFGYSMHHSIEKRDVGVTTSRTPLLDDSHVPTSPNEEGDADNISMNTIKKQD